MDIKNYHAVETSEAFQKGVKAFREKTWRQPGKKYGWYKMKVPIKEWNAVYSHENYTFLYQDGDDFVWIGFLSTTPPEGCLQVTNQDDLQKIDMSRRSKGLMPYVSEG